MILLKTLGLNKRKSPAQTVLILLIESGLVYLGFQVGHFIAGMRARDPQNCHRSDR